MYFLPAKYSLHRRLGASLLFLLLVAALIGTIGSFLIVRGGATDDEFSLPAERSQNAGRSVPADYNQGVVVQIWKQGSGEREYIASSAQTPLPRTLPGLTTMRASGARWDVLTMPAGKDIVQLPELHSRRLREASRLGFAGLVPEITAFATLAVAIALLLSRSLRRLKRFGNTVAMLNVKNPRPIVDINTPAELVPAIVAVNRAMEHLSDCEETKRQFVADAAHALRTPIAAVQLQADNVLGAPAEELAARLGELRRGIGRLTALVSQLTDQAHADAGFAIRTRVTVSLTRVVYTVLEDLLPRAIRRDINIGAGTLQPLVIRAVAGELGILVSNVIDNAIRHSQIGARIDVRIYRNDDNAVVEVTDNGPGIATADLTRIFERFYRGADVQAGGSGLGLSIAQAIAHNYGGRVKLENRTDGTTGVVARIELPLHPEQF